MSVHRFIVDGAVEGRTSEEKGMVIETNLAQRFSIDNESRK